MDHCLPCAGVQVTTPRSLANPSGRDRLLYRVGTHADFFESMLARISESPRGVMAASQAGLPALQGLRDFLRTRAVTDPSIALLDAWAVVADVLTFYQERYANEGFLRTARGLRSLTELAGLVGYQPRPGVAASAYLAFDVEPPPAADTAAQISIPSLPDEVVICKGTPVQSVPRPGTTDLPPVFETSQDLVARADCNALEPNRSNVVDLSEGNVAEVEELAFRGVGLRLKVNDLIGIVPVADESGAPAPEPRLFPILEVREDATANRTTIRTKNALSVTSLSRSVRILLEPQFASAFAGMFLNARAMTDGVTALLNIIPQPAGSGQRQAMTQFDQVLDDLTGTTLQVPLITLRDSIDAIRNWIDQLELHFHTPLISGGAGSLDLAMAKYAKRHTAFSNAVAEARQALKEISDSASIDVTDWRALLRRAILHLAGSEAAQCQPVVVVGRMEPPDAMPAPALLLPQIVARPATTSVAVDISMTCVAGASPATTNVAGLPSGPTSDVQAALRHATIAAAGTAEDYFLIEIKDPAGSSTSATCYCLQNVKYAGVARTPLGPTFVERTIIRPVGVQHPIDLDFDFVGGNPGAPVSFEIELLSGQTVNLASPNWQLQIVIASKQWKLEANGNATLPADALKQLTFTRGDATSVPHVFLIRIYPAATVVGNATAAALRTVIDRPAELQAPLTDLCRRLDVMPMDPVAMTTQVEAFKSSYTQAGFSRLADIADHSKKAASDAATQLDWDSDTILKRQLNKFSTFIAISMPVETHDLTDGVIKYLTMGVEKSAQDDLQTELHGVFIPSIATPITTANRTVDSVKIIQRFDAVNVPFGFVPQPSLEASTRESEFALVNSRDLIKSFRVAQTDAHNSLTSAISSVRGELERSRQNVGRTAAQFIDQQWSAASLAQLSPSLQAAINALRNVFDALASNGRTVLVVAIDDAREKSIALQAAVATEPDAHKAAVAQLLQRQETFLKGLETAPERPEGSKSPKSAADLGSVIAQVNALIGESGIDESTIRSELPNLKEVLPQLYRAIAPRQQRMLRELLRSLRQPAKVAPPRVFVFRTTANVFGWNSPSAMPPITDCHVIETDQSDMAKEYPNRIFLDGASQQVRRGDWIAIHKKGDSDPFPYQVTSAAVIPRSKYCISSQATRLELDRGWWNPDNTATQFPFIQGSRVYCEMEVFELDELPVTAPLARGTTKIKLNSIALDLTIDQPLIIEGQRYWPGAAINEPLATLVRAINFDHIKPAHFGDRWRTLITFTPALPDDLRLETVKIYANVVHATHGETHEEVLGNGDGGEAFQTFTLKRPPLTFVSSPRKSGIDGTLAVRVAGVEWQERESLENPTEFSSHYVTRRLANGSTHVVFGDGVRGPRLPSGVDNVRAHYRSGLGQSGNVDAGQISQLMQAPLGVRGVRNPLAAEGGADGDREQEIRERGLLAARFTERIISVADFANFALAFGGIGKADARQFGGRVLVTVASATPTPLTPESQALRTLIESFNRFAPPESHVEVLPATIILLRIHAGIKIDSRYLWADVSGRVREALLYQFRFDHMRLGQDPLSSDALAAIHSVDGVEFAQLGSFQAVRSKAQSVVLEPDVEPRVVVADAKPSLSTDSQANVTAPATDENGARNQTRTWSAAELCYLPSDIPNLLKLEQIL